MGWLSVEGWGAGGCPGGLTRAWSSVVSGAETWRGRGGCSTREALGVVAANCCAFSCGRQEMMNGGEGDDEEQEVEEEQEEQEEGEEEAEEAEEEDAQEEAHAEDEGEQEGSDDEGRVGVVWQPGRVYELMHGAWEMQVRGGGWRRGGECMGDAGAERERKGGGRTACEINMCRIQPDPDTSRMCGCPPCPTASRC